MHPRRDHNISPGNFRMKLASQFGASLYLLLLLAVVGCGPSGPARIPVKGTVKTVDGKLVDSGGLTFAPVTTDANAPSSPVSTVIKPDGAFEVTGGLVAGKHTVLFEPAQVPFDTPEWDGRGIPPQAPPAPFAGLAPKTKEITVNAGDNALTIELVPNG
jgi:hypothetical protein